MNKVLCTFVLLASICSLAEANPFLQKQIDANNTEIIFIDKKCGTGTIVKSTPIAGEMFLTNNKGGMLKVVDSNIPPPKTWVTEPDVVAVNPTVFSIFYCGHHYLVSSVGGITLLR